MESCSLWCHCCSLSSTFFSCFVLYVWHAHVEATHFSDAQQQQRPAVSTGIANELEYRKTKFAYFICILLIFFLMLHQYMYYTCSVWHFYLTFQKRNNVSFAHHWAAYSVPGRGLIFLSRRRSFSIMMYFCRTLCHCLNIFFFWRDQFSCELTMLSQPFYVFNWFVTYYSQ